MIASWRAMPADIARPCCSHALVLPFMSVNRHVIVPVGCARVAVTRSRGHPGMRTLSTDDVTAVTLHCPVSVTTAKPFAITRSDASASA